MASHGMGTAWFEEPWKANPPSPSGRGQGEGKADLLGIREGWFEPDLHRPQRSAQKNLHPHPGPSPTGRGESSFPRLRKLFGPGSRPDRPAFQTRSKADLVDPAPRDWVKKDATVGDLMDPEVQAVYEDDAALVAAHEMVTKNIHRLVVLNTENQLVGIVSTMDIVRAVDARLTFAIGDLSGTPQVGTL